MALGTVYGFDAVAQKVGLGSYDFENQVFRCYLLSDVASSIDTTTTNPVLGDFTQVAAGGNYTGVFEVSNINWVRSGATTTMQASNITLTADPSNPTTAKSMLMVNQSVTNDAIAVWDLTSDDGVTPIDLVNNDFTFDLATNDILSISKV
jgi:hypothetical protein